MNHTTSSGTHAQREYRIGIDVRLWSQTGVGRYIRNLIDQLQKIDTKNNYILFGNRQDYKDITSHIINSNFQIKIADVRWHSVAEQVMFPKILNKEELDLVHFPYFSVPLFYNKPFVMTMHDLIINKLSTGKASTLPYPVYKMKLFAYNYVLSSALRRSEKIIVPTHSVKDELVTLLNIPQAKIAVTYEGVSLQDDAIAPDTKKHGEYFLYVGNAYPHKNLERLLLAFAEFRKDILDSDIKLVLVGRNDYFYTRLKAYCKTLGIDRYVDFVGDVTDHELSALYKNAVALVTPSVQEGFGLTNIEAFSLGGMVLASDIPVFREVCGDVAVYFDPKNINSIKDKMKMVYYLDAKERAMYQKKAQVLLKQFSWRDMARSTLDIYESCLSVRPG